MWAMSDGIGCVDMKLRLLEWEAERLSDATLMSESARPEVHDHASS
jgi:hypothetical protein